MQRLDEDELRFQQNVDIVDLNRPVATTAAAGAAAANHGGGA